MLPILVLALYTPLLIQHCCRHISPLLSFSPSQIRLGVTNPQQLCIQGGSNGGASLNLVYVTRVTI